MRETSAFSERVRVWDLLLVLVFLALAGTAFTGLVGAAVYALINGVSALEGFKMGVIAGAGGWPIGLALYGLKNWRDAW